MWRSKILTRRSYLKNWKMEKVSLDVFREEEPMETVRSPTKGSTKKMLWKMHGMEL